MSIKFDPTISCQSLLFFNEVSIEFYEESLAYCREHTTAARFIGLPIGLCSATLITAESISSIAESVLKGVTNILGSPFSEKCKLSRGLKNIVLLFPLNIIRTGFNCTLGAVVIVVASYFSMSVNPEEYLKRQIHNLERLNENINGYF